MAIVSAGYSGFATASPEVSTTTTIHLPAISVSAEVPLTKIGEQHMLEKRFAASAVTDGQYVYIVGGQDERRRLLSTVERYDPATNTSEKFCEIKVPRIWHRCVCHAGKIYVIGGKTKSSRPRPASADSNEFERTEPSPGDDFDKSLEPIAATDSMEVIDIEKRSVSDLPNLRRPRAEFGAAILGDDLYVIGGSSVRNNRYSWINTVDVFSLTEREWRDGIPMPKPLGTGVTTVDGPFLVAAGGYNGTASLDTVYAFDPRKNKWLFLPPLSRPSSAHAPVFLGKYLFLFGSYDTPAELLAYNLFEKTSKSYSLRYTPTRHAAAVALQGKIYVIGGKQFKEAQPLDIIQIFAPTKQRE